MDFVIWFLALIGAVVVATVIYGFIVSMPGIGRYARIRRM
jgi:hypothetical protein